MSKHTKIETRSADPINPPEDLTAATQAVEELRTAATAFEQRTDQRITTEMRAANDRIAALETRLNRPGTQTEQTNQTPAEVRAFSSFMRTGVERMQAEEVRALTVSTDAAGGYLAPEQFVTELDRNLVLFSPIRSVARIANASSGEILLPKRTGTMTASWGAEAAPSTATQPAYGQQKINVYELKCYVDVSNRLLEDSAFNMEAELAFDFAEEFGRAEGAAFILGDGTDKPSGILENVDIPIIETAGANIAPDELIDLYHALPGAYAARAVWAMNRTTMGVVRKMKNTAGDYLWREPISEGNPATILGRPVVEMPDLPDANAGETPIIFGDFGSGFRIFDRVNLSVLRDPYSQQTNGLVRFHARRRVGGGVTKAEAFRFLEMTA